MMRFWKQTLLLSLAVGCLASTSGCASFPLSPIGSKSLAACTDPAAAVNGPQAMAVVDLRAAGRDPKVYQMPLEGDMFLHDAIEKSRANRKFRRMDITIVRTSPEGRRHKMDSHYESKRKGIPPEYDYALLPGDYVVIAEDTTNVIDDMFAGLSAPAKVFNAVHGH